MSMILATTWVRRGVAAQFPTKYDIDDAELGRISKLAKLQLEDAQEDLKNARAGGGDGETSESDADGVAPTNGHNESSAKEDDDLKEYNLDDYDKDDQGADGEAQKFSMFGNIGSLAYHAPNEEDPYLVLPEGDNEDDDEREELQILANDNLLLAAKVEDEIAHLEVFVYEDEAENLYVHHDIMLEAVPLCVEWLNIPVGRESGKKEHGNYVAVGTMKPEIEIFNLDVVDSMFPDAVLGQQPDDLAKSSKPKKKKKKEKEKGKVANDEYHVDAVLALAANRQHRNLLASASADKTVKLWDLNTGKCAKSYTMHTDKVCTLDWHPRESTVLLSGSYDRRVVATDMRAPDAHAPTWQVEADVERVRWNIHDPNFFYVTTEAGTVHYYDARLVPEVGAFSKPVWTLHAHDGAVSAFDINPTVPEFLVTGSDDKTVKLWNVADNKPSMVVSRNLEVGRVFSAQFAPDPEVSFRLSVAGSRGQIQVWDTSTNASVRNAFAGRVKMPEGDVRERLIAVKDDSSEEEDDDEDGGVQTEQTTGEGWESMEED